MLHGIVIVPVTDLRAAADSKSERFSQALFGTPVEIRELGKDFAKVALADGYIGWVRISHIDQVAFGLWRSYKAAPKHKVKTEMVQVEGTFKDGLKSIRLYFGTELVITSKKGKTTFELPLGSCGTIAKSHLVMPGEKGSRGVSGARLIGTAKRFLGVPYLWGGITPAGYDCSGLVQMVYGFYGIRLPRNSVDQRGCGFEIARADLKAGDLIFFPGHVAISCGGDEIIHASASRGMVAVESLSPDGPHYRKDLDDGYLFSRRLPL
jgi:gamma-D-glutamyl-L-lysine dipeptidyl-peptidase